MTDPSAPLGASTRRDGPRLVLQLRGELDVVNRDVLRRVLDVVVEQNPQILEVDLSGVGFADLGTLAVFVPVHTHLASHGHELIISGARPLARRLLAVSGLDTLFTVTEPGREGEEGVMA